jgi:hypothetical protein
MNANDFPLFPVRGAHGPEVCEAARFYLGIVHELPFEQVSILSEHVRECPTCATEFRLLQQATRLVAQLPASAPSARVDRAVQLALQNRTAAARIAKRSSGSNIHRLVQRSARRTARRPWQSVVGLSAVLALVVLLLLVGLFWRGLFFPSSNAQAFQLPADLSWNGYVLHYIRPMLDSQGKTYQVEVYQDLGSNQMHIESSMQGQFDVVVVTGPGTETQDMLGKDMMHHVAELGSGVQNWSVDGSLFDLAQLRQGLGTHQLVYLGKETVQGLLVYLVQASDGEVLLLNMQYFPVNVLQHFTRAGSGTMLYTTFDVMPSSIVSASMWDMQVPSGFRMGQLPARS